MFVTGYMKHLNAAIPNNSVTLKSMSHIHQTKGTFKLVWDAVRYHNKTYTAQGLVVGQWMSQFID